MVLAHTHTQADHDLMLGRCDAQWFMSPAARRRVMAGEVSQLDLVDIPTHLFLGRVAAASDAWTIFRQARGQLFREIKLRDLPVPTEPRRHDSQPQPGYVCPSRL
jgi:hypothetical protein